MMPHCPRSIYATEANYLVSVIPGIEHDDRSALMFIDHSPQVNHRVWQRHLCYDERTATTVALRITHRTTTDKLSTSDHTHIHDHRTNSIVNESVQH